jgi:hypothetical protein
MMMTMLKLSLMSMMLSLLLLLLLMLLRTIRMIRKMTWKRLKKSLRMTTTKTKLMTTRLMLLHDKLHLWMNMMC